jgi:LmbE family N-acetylglucosaminyl deacetylase
VILLLFLPFFSLVIALLWMTEVVYINDFFLAPLQVETFTRVLLVYPHPDDEVHVAGLVRTLADRGVRITLLTLTEGEKSQRSGLSSEVLRAVRKKELEKATALLGVTKVIQANYGDQELSAKYVEVKKGIAQVMEEECPDVVITYDLSGLYGHLDHIMCSQIVTELLESTYHGILLFYNTYPKRVLSRFPLTEELRKRQASPTLRLFIGFQVCAKMKALYAYKSQLGSFRRGLPTFIPLWLAYSMLLCEYYHSATTDTAR